MFTMNATFSITMNCSQKQGAGKKKTYGNDLVTKGVFTVAQEIRKHCIFTRFEIHRFDWKLPSLFGGGGRIEQIETFSCELPCRDN